MVLPDSLGFTVSNLFWFPVLEYLEAFSNDTVPEWTKTLALHHSAVLAEMAGAMAGANEALTMDDWLKFLQTTITKFRKVGVPTRLLLQLVSPMALMHVEPIPANAFHLLRTCWCKKLVGPAMATQLYVLPMSEVAYVPVQVLSEPDLASRIRQDLVDQL